MNSVPRNGSGNLAWLIALGLVLLFAAWRVLSLGLADHFAEVQPARALSWRPNHPSALIAAAELLTAKDPARSGALARAALHADPREGRAFRVLGELADRRGDKAQALTLYELAVTRSPRDLPTRWWLERHYLLAGQLRPALLHLEVLLRVDPELSEYQFPLLQRLAAIPQAQTAVAEMLARRPPWREGFLAGLSSQAPDSAAIAPVMSRLLVTPGGFSNAELTAWLARLGRDGRWGEAYLTWVSSLPDDQQASLANVFNGGFEREPSNLGFDWRFDPVAGAYIERLPASGASGALALRVSFEDRRVRFQHVRQLLVLAPGRYRLQGRARAEGLRSERGLVWDVKCAEDNRPLAGTEPLSGTTPWRSFDVALVVPASNCGGQWLQLSVPARIPAEQRIAGRAWFDELRIVRDP